MEGSKTLKNIIPLLCVIFLISVSVYPVYGQMNTTCTASMITSIAPCVSFITQNITGNGSSSGPSPGCCSSIKSLLSSSMNCACLVITGNIPFQIPINRTLAISLPQACKLDGVPVQCNASAAPVPAPAPGPASFGLAPSPSSPSPSPGGSTDLTPTLAPRPDTTLGSPPVNTENPTASPGLRPVPTPTSAAKISIIPVPPALLLVLGLFMVLKLN